jgi:hypothetical protein
MSIDVETYPARLGPQQVADEPASDSGTSTAGHKRRVNELIDAIVEGPRSELTGFICECGSVHCLRTVWLTADEFAMNRAQPDWVVWSLVHSAAALG